MYRQKYLFLLPGLLVLVAIILFPLLFTIRVSFSGWDVYNPGLNWIGGENYARLAEDARYWQALTSTLICLLLMRCFGTPQWPSRSMSSSISTGLAPMEACNPEWERVIRGFTSSTTGP